MKNDLMKKVGELLDMAGVDENTVKAVTEKLADEIIAIAESKALKKTLREGIEKEYQKMLCFSIICGIIDYMNSKST